MTKCSYPLRTQNFQQERRHSCKCPQLGSTTTTAARPLRALRGLLIRITTMAGDALIPIGVPGKPQEAHDARHAQDQLCDLFVQRLNSSPQLPERAGQQHDFVDVADVLDSPARCLRCQARRDSRRLACLDARRTQPLSRALSSVVTHRRVIGRNT